ncbi:MAG: AAA family ATPase, partial [Lachnospiraceae bacterium]|nr:AAA family ATPase [Lachnospiraceae bacterium]
HNQTLNALLQRMDGLNEANGIMVIGATNRKEDLDPALLRPGRFDRHYYVGAPDNKKDRDEIVEIYLKNKKLDEAVTIEKASKLMVGLTGAEIEQTMNEAVYISLQDNRKGVIKLSDIDEAVMKLHTGGVVKEHTAKRDMQITAIHEAGHTIVSLLEDIEIAKVSIVAYSSGVGGVTVRDMDRTGDIKLKLKSEYEKEIRILLAGKVAEEIKYGEHTQGCVNDIEKATELIYRMVTSYGFDNEALFNINKLEDNGIQNALKNDIIEKCNKELKLYNEQTEKMLREHIEKLDKLVDRLYEEKTIVSPSLDMLS